MSTMEGEVNTRVDDIVEVLVSVTGAVAVALDDVCSYGFIIGESYVPFDPDDDDECEIEDDELPCTQMWLRVAQSEALTYTPTSFGNGGCASTMRMTVEVGIIRCITVEEGGAAPKATDLLMSASQAMTDMQTIFDAVMAFEDERVTEINSGQWTPFGPLGGQYGGTWNFTLDL